MGITRKLEKTVWAEFAGRCGICRSDLVIEVKGSNSRTLVGDVAHIVSESADGPRGEFHLSNEEMKSHENYLLLCKAHHKEIDDNHEVYTVEKLREIRSEHISWVNANLVELKPVSISLANLTYINVPRLAMLAAQYGFKVDGSEAEEARSLHSLGLALNGVMAKFQALLARLEPTAIALGSVKGPFHGYVGVTIAFNARFRTKNVPRPDRESSYNNVITGVIAKDPHIYIKKDNYKLILTIDPRWITTSTAFTLFHPSSGHSVLAGLAIITNVEPELGVITATPLVIGTPRSEFMDRLDGRKPRESIRFLNGARAVNSGQDPYKLEQFIDYERAKEECSVWSGDIEGCDLCGKILANAGYFVDGGMRASEMWANMCPECFWSEGRGKVGWGVGQLYELQKNGDWLCVGGFQPKDDLDRYRDLDN